MSEMKITNFSGIPSVPEVIVKKKLFFVHKKNYYMVRKRYKNGHKLVFTT